MPSLPLGAEAARQISAQAERRCDRARALLARRKAEVATWQARHEEAEARYQALGRARTAAQKKRKAGLRRALAALGVKIARAAERLDEARTASRVLCAAATRAKKGVQAAKAYRAKVLRAERARARRVERLLAREEAKRQQAREEHRRVAPPEPPPRHQPPRYEEIVAEEVEAWMRSVMEEMAAAVGGVATVDRDAHQVVRGRVIFRAVGESVADAAERLRAASGAWYGNVLQQETYTQGRVTRAYTGQVKSPDDFSRALGTAGQRAHTYETSLFLGDLDLTISTLDEMDEKIDHAQGAGLVPPVLEINAFWSPDAHRPSRTYRKEE